MALAKQLQLTSGLDTLFNELPRDIWLGTIAEQFETPEIVCMRAVSKSLRDMMSDDELWLHRMAALALAHPVLTDLTKGIAETAYDWYKRCHVAIDSGHSLEAEREKQAARPKS